MIGPSPACTAPFWKALSNGVPAVSFDGPDRDRQPEAFCRRPGVEGRFIGMSCVCLTTSHPTFALSSSATSSVSIRRPGSHCPGQKVWRGLSVSTGREKDKNNLAKDAAKARHGAGRHEPDVLPSHVPRSSTLPVRRPGRGPAVSVDGRFVARLHVVREPGPS